MILALAILAHAEPGAAIERCLAQWPDHPFGDAPEATVLSPSVRVLGIGPRQRSDTATERAELVLVRPSVNLLSKTTLTLDNPNGWYCIDTPVGVASKVVIDLHCNARIADAHQGRSFVGHRDVEAGWTVLASLRVEQSCSVQALAPAEPEPERHVASEPAPVGQLPR